MRRSLPNASRALPLHQSASRKKKSTAGSEGQRLGPTPERLARATEAGSDAIGEVITEVTAIHGATERTATVRLYDGDVLELLFRRQVIDQEQYACGKEYHRHWHGSGLASAGVVDPARERVDGGTFKPESETRLWHLTRWSQLTRELGEIHSRVLLACVLLDESLQDYGLKHSKQRDPKRAGSWAQGRITGALEQLVFIMLGERRSNRQRGSMMAGARPVIPPSENDD